MPRRFTTAALAGALAACGLAPAPPAAAQEDRVFYRLGPVEVLGDGPSRAVVGAGAFDVDFEDDGDTAPAALVELRLGDKAYFIGPAAGLLATTDGAVFGYGGLYADIRLGDVVVTPFGGIGGYAEGDGKDLGGVFQFRTAVTVSYAFANGSRLGAQVAHISNAGIHDRNPGENDLFLTYSVPF